VTKRWQVGGAIAGELICAPALSPRERALAREPRNCLAGHAIWGELDQPTRWGIARALGLHESHLYDGPLMRATFEHAVSDGRIVGLRFDDPHGRPLRPRWRPHTRRAGAPPPLEAPPAPAPQPETAAFELVLTDVVGRTPLVGVPLRIRTPAGQTRVVTTDASGTARIPALEAGHCRVQSVIDDARVTDSYGPSTRAPVLGAGGAAPARGPAHVVSVVSHRIATGQTPASIARQWNRTWDEIALFNWGTTAPAELEARYRDTLGCTKKTPDGRNHRFDDADDPGIVLIPQPWEASLATGHVHRLGFEPLRAVTLTLANEAGLALPGARYHARFTDGTERSGQLGRSGLARLTGVPDAPFWVAYPDDADTLARSLAASVRRDFDRQQTGALFSLLGQSGSVVANAVAVYDEYFNDLTGAGFAADIDQVVTDPEARGPLLFLCALAGVKVEGSEDVVLAPRPR
jgi:hypothetical protein